MTKYFHLVDILTFVFLLYFREKKLSRCSALKVLDYAMTGPEGGDNCNKFIEILGLRNLFPLFMKVIILFTNI